MQKRAIVCVTNDLSTDQRVHKTCLTLQKAGYDVTEYGRLLADSIPLERPYGTIRKRLHYTAGPQFYAEYNVRLFWYLLTARYDLVFSNDLDTLPACWLASRLRRKRLIYDTHEYFTETPELTHRKGVQRIWKMLEDFLFPKLKDVLTVNESIARLYRKQYGIDVKVSRNIPVSFEPEHLRSRKELGLPEDRKILILQGTGINIQRGAEEAVLAMRYLDGTVLLIAGSGDVLPLLKEMVREYGLEDKVLFRAKMPFTELRHYTMNADLGLAIDKNTNLNYQFSLPNKLFDYIHSGIPVLSSGLVELKLLIDRYDIGYYIDRHDPEHIAEVIRELFADSAGYEQKRHNTAKAKAELCWEQEERVLLSVVRNEKL